MQNTRNKTQSSFMLTMSDACLLGKNSRKHGKASKIHVTDLTFMNISETATSSQKCQSIYKTQIPRLQSTPVIKVELTKVYIEFSVNKNIT